MQVISDYQLFAMLALFIAIDLLVIVIREVIDPQRANQHFTGREVRRQGLHKKSAFDTLETEKKIADAFPMSPSIKRTKFML